MSTIRIFLNTHGKDDENITPELKELLYFMDHTNDPDLVIQSDNVRKLHNSVRAIQKNEEIGVRYMQLWEEKIMGEQEARAEGRAEGTRNATMDNIRNLMDSLKISLEQSMDILKIPAAEREEYQTMM
ncbi:MAG: hypothetical protein LIO96_01795 [Lachnospiraceae bacterium]|nr:hypothetical protein [Lachnospiraceae bacterium]